MCLYDFITADDKVLWQQEVDKYSSEVSFMVSGTKREREQRAELVNLVQLMFSLSRDLDEGDVFKACFQLPAANRGNAFAVKFTPHFGQLPRPKKNVNAKISSMVFGQGTMEMVIQSLVMKHNQIHTNEAKETKLICVVFYGQNVPFLNAKTLASELLSEFHRKYNKQVTRLITKYEMNNSNESNNNENKNDNPLFEQATSNDNLIDNKNRRNNDKSSKNIDATELDQESIMSQFNKTFEVTAQRLIQKHIDTRELRRKDRENENANDIEHSVDDIYSLNNLSDNDEVKTSGNARGNNNHHSHGNNNNNNGAQLVDSGVDSGLDSPFGNDESKSQSDSQASNPSNQIDNNNNNNNNNFSETDEKQQDMYHGNPYSQYNSYKARRQQSKYAGSRYDL